MSGRKMPTGLRFLLSFLIFFGLAGFVVTCAFLLFLNGMEIPREQLATSASFTLLNVVALSFVFAVIDILRRIRTVDCPVAEIKSVLDKITDGDFSVRLQPHGEFGDIMEKINQMTEELSGVETLRSDFVANVSHELKTPLAVMQNYGTMLRAPDLTEEQRLEYADAVTDSAKRLASLITNILKLNKLENQQIFPKKEPFDISDQLCAVLLEYESVWEKKTIDLAVNIEEGVTVCGDRELLGLVWSNLLSNAFKFTDEGGTVEVTLTADEGFATVTVRDTGCGMDAETGRHIFEKFYQGDTSHSTRGNGLGLALVKRIMDITGGEITVSSTPGAGSTFSVRIGR